MSLARLLVFGAVAATKLAQASQLDIQANNTDYARLQALGWSAYATSLGELTSNATCNPENIVIRRSW